MLTKWNSYFNSFDNLFDSLFTPTYSFSYTKPFFGVYKEDKNLCLEADVPGLSREDLDINVDDRVLTIKGETKKEDTKSYRKYSFTKQYILPDGLDINTHPPEAELIDGILRVKFKDFYKELSPPEKKVFKVPIH